MNFKYWSFIITLFLVCTSCRVKEINPVDYKSDLLLDWNRLIMEYAIEEDGLLTLKDVRTEAMMHTAIHNALNHIVPLYQTYKVDREIVLANPSAAAAQAAYNIIVSQYPHKE